MIHQIPAKPNYLRIKIGRRLQSLGAVAIKNSVYVLPRNDQSHEDFEWIAREIVKARGDASVCEARFVEGLSDQQIEGLFNAAREADYMEIAKKARELAGSFKRRRKIDEGLRGDLESGIARLRKRLSDVSAIDFFAANGSQAAEAILADIEERLRKPAVDSPTALVPSSTPRDVHGRIWVTRRGIHVDRMASAWLIRRFIDPEASFKFVPGKGYRPEPGELRFDMFEAEFTHDGDRCTFEVLFERFELDDPALRPIAEIVHDIDLKDSKFSRPEVLGLDRLIAGICMATKEDEVAADAGPCRLRRALRVLQEEAGMRPGSALFSLDKEATMRRIIASAALLGVLTFPVYAASEKTGEVGTALDTASIEKLTGIKGTFDEKEQVYKVSAPRKDLQVISKTVHITPPMGLTSWAAFKRAGTQTMVMGDTV